MVVKMTIVYENREGWRESLGLKYDYGVLNSSLNEPFRSTSGDGSFTGEIPLPLDRQAGSLSYFTG